MWVSASTTPVSHARLGTGGEIVCRDLDALDRWVGIEPWHGWQPPIGSVESLGSTSAPHTAT
jgi:hypothetical protein